MKKQMKCKNCQQVFETEETFIKTLDTKEIKETTNTVCSYTCACIILKVQE